MARDEHQRDNNVRNLIDVALRVVWIVAAPSHRRVRNHRARRPKANPVAAWRAALPQHLEKLAARDMDYFHLYAFNLPRQLGANFEMLGSYVFWLAERGVPGLSDVMTACRRIAEGAKAVQFQLARMANRRKFDAARLELEPIEKDYAVVLSVLAGRFG